MGYRILILQTFQPIRQRNSLVRQEACSRPPHTYASIYLGGRVARWFNCGANFPDTVSSGRDWTRATWSRNEYGSTMPVRRPTLIANFISALNINLTILLAPFVKLYLFITFCIIIPERSSHAIFQQKHCNLY